jgi:pSer/pThr/pTyr-binding forkhead associated (FHA) protein
MTSGRITVSIPDTESYSLDVEEDDVMEVGRKPSPKRNRKLTLPFPEVSGLHAEIHCYSSGWTVADSGSTNGTTLNGRRLIPGRHYPLRAADIIKICENPPQYELQVFPPPGTPVRPEEEAPDERYYRLLAHELKQQSSEKSSGDGTGTSNGVDGQ